MKAGGSGMARSVASLLASLVLVGCGLVPRESLLPTGPPSSFDAQALKADTMNQSAVVKQLAIRGGLSQPAPYKPDEWKMIINAGIEYADIHCESYLAVLDRVSRNKKTIVNQIGLVGAASAGLMAAAKSAAREVSAVAILFGLGAATAENLGGNVLYEIDPSSVRIMVKALQERYKSAVVVATFKSRSEAFSAIQQYAVLCTPANIEAEVNVLIKQANPIVSVAPNSGVAPRVTNAVVTADVSYAPDANSARIIAYVEPGGTIDPNRLKTVIDYLESQGEIDSYAIVLVDPKHAALRQRLVKTFQLNE